MYLKTVFTKVTDLEFTLTQTSNEPQWIKYIVLIKSLPLTKKL